MNYTSAQASKLLSALQQEHDRIAVYEENASSFLASVGEDPESVRPEYSYGETKAQLFELEAKIRKVKHAINLFNTTTVIPGFGMTVDEMLVYLPQLSRRKVKLKQMADCLPKARYGRSSGSLIIDYKYINYDPAAVKADLDSVTKELADAQIALDTVNHTEVFDIDV